MSSFKVTLKANEKLYLNGAVIRADRKVSIEFLNDVQFLLENHVLQAEEASTPLRQLYFVVQIMLMNPKGVAAARTVFRQSLTMLLGVVEEPGLQTALKDIDRLVGEDQFYEALKTIRALYPIEARILEGQTPAPVLLAGE